MIVLPVQRKLLVRSSAKRFPLALLISVAILLATLLCAAPSHSADPAEFARPEVLVLVLGGFGASDEVSINYATVVPLPKAQSDLDAIAALGEWKVTDAKGETKSLGGPHPVPTTSTSFATKGIIDSANGTLHLEPFITALRRFKYIEVDYLAPAGFQFHGLEDFENRYVKINLGSAGNTYRYHIVVKNTGFSKLDLPLLQPRNPKEAARGGGMPLSARIALGVVLGLLGALLVYFLTGYFTRRRTENMRGRE